MDNKYAAAIIAIQDGQVLMVRSKKRGGTPELPGGALLPNETFQMGAARELWEECGLYVDAEELQLFHMKDAHGWHVHLFLATDWSGELNPGDDASAAFFGDPALLLEGERSEDYETACRAIERSRSRDGG